MYNHKKCIAMLLAGGQGSRLYALTSKVAKPAVSFGAKYRIIDFTLSNCVNSGIDTVGVLTQYQPLILNDYIGNGQPWDLDRTFGGVHVLPPYLEKDRSDWYKGTANAIYQNLGFINSYNPDHVLILSGDHIYKMDYNKMLDYHIKQNADCTIAVLEVTLEEATRFGIMNTDENNNITEFEEKPAHPKSTKASMGIYIFKKSVLEKYLIMDEANPNSKNDFGKNIIPMMLENHLKMVAYPFKGYWKDVGTIKSLWEANRDLIGPNPKFDIYDSSWKIHSRNIGVEPQYVGKKAVIKDSIVAGGAKIYGTVINSIIGPHVKIEDGAIVKDSVVFANALIGKNAIVNYSIIDENVKIGQKAQIGIEMEISKGITTIGRDTIIPDEEVILDDLSIEYDYKTKEVK